MSGICKSGANTGGLHAAEFRDSLCQAFVEACDGVDNDQDGDVDEGFDANGNGFPDCLDALDDGDGDGVPDRDDIEVCDKLDNDGSGVVDDHVDLDGDGLSDCVANPCTTPAVELLTTGQFNYGPSAIFRWLPATNVFSRITGRSWTHPNLGCDGLDNDGDGETDEGYDSDEDGVPDCYDSETCDGGDNDGDGLVDEGWDANGNGVADCVEPELCDCKDNDGDGAVDETCEYALDVAIAGISSWQATLDGAPWGVGSVWNQVGRLSTTVMGGAHTIAVKIDAGNAPVAGFIATGTLAGVPLAETGSGDWRSGTTTPARWAQAAPATLLPEMVSAVPPPMLAGLGTAAWVWTKDGRKPTAFPMNAAVLQVFACGERVASNDDPCNGFDDDRDGVVDEEHPDADGDGILDCVDGEKLCDGGDDDGDGFVDEGFGDADLDGIADCKDKETCDGLDNDGDGFIDEQVIGCGSDAPETACNCIDDDLDGVVDDGCLYTIRVTAEAVGDVRIFGRGVVIADGVGTADVQITGVAAKESVAIGVEGTTGGGTLGGLRAAVDVEATGGLVWTRLEVGGPPSWSGSSAVEPPGTWPNVGFETPAMTSKCKPTGSPALDDAPWLWSGECSGLAVPAAYRIARQVVICK